MAYDADTRGEGRARGYGVLGLRRCSCQDEHDTDYVMERVTGARHRDSLIDYEEEI